MVTYQTPPGYISLHEKLKCFDLAFYKLSSKSIIIDRLYPGRFDIVAGRIVC